MRRLQFWAGLTLVAVCVAAILWSLPGCALLTPPGSIPVSEKLSAPAQAAQHAINEANVLLTAAANVIASNVLDGITPKEEAKALLARVKALAADVDRAQRLLEAGEVGTAKDRADLARRLVVALHREVAAKSRRTP